MAGTGDALGPTCTISRPRISVHRKTVKTAQQTNKQTNMPAAPSIDWTTYVGSGHLPGGTFIRAAGAPRKANEPAVVIECGWNSSTAEWVLVLPLIAQFARVYVYDRSGYGQSLRSRDADPPTTAVRAKELKGVLEAAGVAPPFVLVGHSYGGTIVRQYLLDQPEEVVGMVLVDTPPRWAAVGPPGWPGVTGPLLGGATYNEMNGLEASQCMTKEEWTGMREEQASELHKSTTDAEAAFVADGMTKVSDEVEGKQPLGSKRLSVIHGGMGNDFKKLNDWATKHQNGTDEEREQWRKMVEDGDWDSLNKGYMREQLKLSSQSRWIEATGVAETHNLQFTNVGAELILKEVKWVLGLD